MNFATHNHTHELGGFQSFRIGGYVCVGSPNEVIDFREGWKMRKSWQLGFYRTKRRPLATRFSDESANSRSVSQIEHQVRTGDSYHLCRKPDCAREL